ncbi:Coenzyme Q-binding protein COQ10 START domain-containing protein [Frankia sp. AiPs1]|uniref:SRPBCC family protein n=1 Tax=Frankia sp. AiPa1 TaxID=573492 RepID=UPI00202B6DDC|nr:SRPBCC family protein [Frankia sp. AiPa1]MCL9759129.1 SRPBCC family protein [Frankia sp. AiPa1]
MASTVQESIEVHVPIRTAYNQWTQFESFPHFMDGVESIAQIDNTHTHWKIKVAGQAREFDATITEQLPDERVAWKSTGGAQHAGVVTFHRLADDETRVTVQMDWQPEGLTEKAGAAFGADDRRVKADLRRFKAFIEDRQTETGAWRGEVPRPDAAGGYRAGAAGVAGGEPDHAGRAGDSSYGGAGGSGYGDPARGSGYGSPAGGSGYGDSAGGAGYGGPASGPDYPTPGASGQSAPRAPGTPGSSAGGW